MSIQNNHILTNLNMFSTSINIVVGLVYLVSNSSCLKSIFVADIIKEANIPKASKQLNYLLTNKVRIFLIDYDYKS